MTAREFLNRRKRRLAAFVLGGVALTVAGAVAVPLLGAGAGAGAAVGVVMLIVGAIAGQLGGLRCPFCRENLGKVLMNAVGWRLNPKVRYCPCCGAELDRPTPDTAAAAPDGADW